MASGATSLQLSRWDGTDFSESVQAISEEPGPDLAILSGESEPHPAVLGDSDAPDGTQVWVAGYPEGNQLTLTPGIVLDYIGGSAYGVLGQIMELTNAIQPGNSGSPVLDSHGIVVGVAFAVNRETGNSLAIPASEVLQFLRSPGSDSSGTCAP